MQLWNQDIERAGKEKMRPLIVLTAGFEEVRGMEQRQLFQNYADAIYEAGGQPVLALGADKALAEKMDGLFLTGGVDIEPCRYKTERKAWCQKSDLKRDEEEFKLFDEFIRQKKPILGVCRGLQLVNVALGGTLWQDQKEECGIGGHTDGVVHDVKLEEHSVIKSLFGQNLRINSYHHQSVKTLGKGLKITAKAGEIIEGVEHENLPVLAVQWHPERMTGKCARVWNGVDMKPLFEWFVKTCEISC